MYSVRADLLRNCLFIEFSEVFDLNEAHTIRDAILAELKKLKPGASLVNDMTHFQPATTQVAGILQELQHEIFKHGVTRVIRILGASAIAKMQIERTRQAAGAAYEVHTVASMDEALALLQS